MSTLSVVILTKNEENNILDCLESIKSLDEIMIIDDYSEDRTLEIIRNFDSKIKIFQRKLDRDFSAQRNFGLNKTTCEWVLFLDADERVSEALASEISNFQFPISNDIGGFYIKRRDVMWGKELMYGEAGDIKLLRLARKSAGEWRGKVHETWSVKGRVGILDNALMHYPHQTIREFLSEVGFYSTIKANELAKENIKVSLLDIVLYPKGKFILNYFVKLGFLDGLPGLIVALIMSFHSFLVRGKLWLLIHAK